MTKVVMSDEERMRVEARAIALGISVPRTLVEAAMGVPPLTRTERLAVMQELTGVKFLLANLTNNVNQIARALNSDVDVPAERINAVLARAQAAADRVEELSRRFEA